MKLSKNAKILLEKRYLIKDKNGKVTESPEDMLHRVAYYVAGVCDGVADIAYKKSLAYDFYYNMSRLIFLPNTPTLINAKRGLNQLSACFVLPIEDSIKSIYEVLKVSALIHQSGGGTGFNFSNIRPKNSLISTSYGRASGPLSFAKVYDVSSEQINQGGVRRGANMGVLNVDHPDIMKFIHCKDKDGEFKNFNLSVALSEDFMLAVKNNTHYRLINPQDKEVVKVILARKIYSAIIEQAWKTGDPGVLFIDNINQANEGLDMDCTNPCGEQPLYPYESCNLGSINVAHPDFLLGYSGLKHFHFAAFESKVENCINFLDNVIDVNKYPIPLIEKATRRTRKIGLGIMGFADLLVALRIPYDSESALYFAENLAQSLRDGSVRASKALAKEKGTFPASNLPMYSHVKDQRNATTNTIAPTGSLSIIADCSSGIEPIFARDYTKNILGTQLKEESKHKSPFPIAHEIAPEWHVRMQAAFQRYIDNAVSKTVNLKASATKEDVKEVFDLAYYSGCKGITVYRDGSKKGQVLCSSEGECPTCV